MKWLQSLSAIVIDPKRCPQTKREFSAYEYERNKDGEIMNSFPDKNNLLPPPLFSFPPALAAKSGFFLALLAKNRDLRIMIYGSIWRKAEEAEKDSATAFSGSYKQAAGKNCFR